MSSITNQFAWKDRDTAARNMLQFANYAPPSIRSRALQLLKAFRSPVILSELKQIVIDEERDAWERRYALRAIASIPDDIYLPEFARLVSVGDGKLNFAEFVGLFSKHPSNLQWAFHSIEQLPPKEYLKKLHRSTNYLHEGIDLNPILCHRIMEVIEQNPLFMNLDLIDTLYYRDGSETTLKWLHDRWNTIIYICLIVKIDKVFRLLAGWDELREAVFKQCPSCIEEYEQKKQDFEIRHLQFQTATVDYQSTAVWQELSNWYQAAAEGDQQAYRNLVKVVYHERKNLSKRAVATNLLGKLNGKYDVRLPLFHALRYAPDDLQYQHLSMNASIRFEAGEALRDVPLPDVWETMVDAFFIRPRNVLESFMSAWIEHLTDRLSGIEAPYTGIRFGDENRRFWFRALAEANESHSI